MSPDIRNRVFERPEPSEPHTRNDWIEFLAILAVLFIIVALA